MSLKLVSRSPDLSRLRADGYDIAVRKSGHLLVRDVPYVNCAKEVHRGILVSELNVAGEATAPPETHVALFVGSCPCSGDGSPLPGVSPNVNQVIDSALTLHHSMSRKPTRTGKYQDYYEKITTYIDIISGPAQAIDPKVTARTHPVVVPEEDDSMASVRLSPSTNRMA
jgi:hypothetical protein